MLICYNFLLGKKGYLMRIGAILKETEILEYKAAIANKCRCPDKDKAEIQNQESFFENLLVPEVCPIWTTVAQLNCKPDKDVISGKSSLGNKASCYIDLRRSPQYSPCKCRTSSSHKGLGLF